MKKENLDDELKVHSPLLRDLKAKGDGFKIPEGYFGHMENAVFSRLKSAGDLERPAMKVVKRPSIFPLTIRPKTALSMAAALALLLVAVWFVRQPTAVQPMPYVSTELTEDELEAYVLENVHEFDPEQLAVLSPEKLSEPVGEPAPGYQKRNSSHADEIHPDDLDEILDEMTDEELEQIL